MTLRLYTLRLLYQAYFYYRYALFYRFEKRYKEALQVAEQALKLKYSIPLRLKVIKWLIADNQFEVVLDFIFVIHKLLDQN